MINWIGVRTISIKSDVNISWTCKRSRLLLKVSSGAIATKFRHAERIAIGVDQKLKRVYLKGGSVGYKPHYNKSGQASILLSLDTVERFIGNERPSELIGDYELSYDKENDAYFFDIGALSR